MASRNQVQCRPHQTHRETAKGGPGLAFETWDPCNQCFMDTLDVTTGQRIPLKAVPFV